MKTPAKVSKKEIDLYVVNQPWDAIREDELRAIIKKQKQTLNGKVRV